MSGSKCVVNDCTQDRESRHRECSMHRLRRLRHGDHGQAGRIRAEHDPDGYEAVHLRLNKERGPASAHACVSCRAPATEWAYDRLDENERSGPMRASRQRPATWSTDPDHYQPMCTSCHRRLDYGKGVK